MVSISSRRTRSAGPTIASNAGRGVCRLARLLALRLRPRKCSPSVISPFLVLSARLSCTAASFSFMTHMNPSSSETGSANGCAIFNSSLMTKSPTWNPRPAHRPLRTGDQSCDFISRSFGMTSENRQIDGFGHRFVTVVVGMQMVEDVVNRTDLLRVVRVLNSRVKIDDRIVCAARTNPLVDRLADRLTLIGGVGCADIRCQRCTDYLDPVEMGPFYDLLVCSDQVMSCNGVGWLRPPPAADANIIDSFQHDQPLHARLA